MSLGNNLERYRMAISANERAFFERLGTRVAELQLARAADPVRVPIYQELHHRSRIELGRADLMIVQLDAELREVHLFDKGVVGTHWVGGIDVLLDARGKQLVLITLTDDIWHLSTLQKGAIASAYDRKSWGITTQTEFVTLKLGRGQHRKYLPYVFTEHGAIMAATILNSPRAVEMSVYVVRAFVQLREMLASNKELARRFAQLETRLDKKLTSHDEAIAAILSAIRQLMHPPVPKRRPIGFTANLSEKS